MRGYGDPRAEPPARGRQENTHYPTAGVGHERCAVKEDSSTTSQVHIMEVSRVLLSGQERQSKTENIKEH